MQPAPSKRGMTGDLLGRLLQNSEDARNQETHLLRRSTLPQLREGVGEGAALSFGKVVDGCLGIFVHVDLYDRAPS